MSADCNITILPISTVIKYNKVPGINGYHIIYSIKLNNIHLDGESQYGLSAHVFISKEDIILIAKIIIKSLNRDPKDIVIPSLDTLSQFCTIELSRTIKIDQSLVPDGLKRKGPIYIEHMTEDNILCGIFHITVLEFRILRETNDTYICDLSNIIIHSNEKMLQFQDDGIQSFKEWEEQRLRGEQTLRGYNAIN